MLNIQEVETYKIPGLPSLNKQQVSFFVDVMNGVEILDAYCKHYLNEPVPEGTNAGLRAKAYAVANGKWFQSYKDYYEKLMFEREVAESGWNFDLAILERRRLYSLNLREVERLAKAYDKEIEYYTNKKLQAIEDDQEDKVEYYEKQILKATKTLNTKFVYYLRKVVIMTNEQVIINKIDVSECEHLTETRHCKANMAVMGTDANRCKCFPNCHYKQLVRKKKECEKLKKQYNCYACDTCNGKEDYVHLKKHCENAIKSLHNKQAEINRLKADNKQLKEELSKVYEDIKLSPLCYKCDKEECLQKEINQLKADNEQLQVKEQECLTLINKVNRLEEEKNTLQILLEGQKAVN